MFEDIISDYIKAVKNKKDVAEGFNFYTGGKINNFVQSGSECSAVVEDNGNSYTAKVVVDEDKVHKYKCSCGSSKEICSHVCGLLYYIESLKGDDTASKWFDFSLNDIYLDDSSHLVDSKDIPSQIEDAVLKADKNKLSGILVGEVKSDINLGYRLLSQLYNMNPKDEGMLFKSRIIDLLENLNKSNVKESSLEELDHFAVTLLQTIQSRVENNRLENAFILSMLLIEILNFIKPHGNQIEYLVKYREFIENKVIPVLHIVVMETAASGNAGIKKTFLNELMLLINKSSNEKNILISGYILYFASLLSDDKTENKVRHGMRLLKSRVGKSGNILTNFVESGIRIGHGNLADAVSYIEKHIKNVSALSIIVDTLLFNKHFDEAERIITVTAGKNLGKQHKYMWYSRLQDIYFFRNNKEKMLENAFMLLSLGDTKEYYTVRKMLVELSRYNQEKDRLHDTACSVMPVYEYCLTLAENDEYAYMIDRFSRIKTSKELKSAIEFMDDSGIALYKDNTNVKLLEILQEKSVKIPKYNKHITSLLELISI